MNHREKRKAVNNSSRYRMKANSRWMMKGSRQILKDSSRYRKRNSNRQQLRSSKLGRQLKHLLSHKMDKILRKNSKLKLPSKQ